MGDAARCIAFLRAFAERRAARIVPFRFGRAYFDDELPLAPDLNAVSVEAEAPANELLEDVERLQAPLRHRLVWVDDDALGARLAPAFVGAGYTVLRNLVMVQARPGPAVETRHVAEVDTETLTPVWARGIVREAGAHAELVRQLVAAQLARRRAARVRYFAILEGGAPVSYCELFSDGATGQIESVMTLEEHRRKGHASAVVSHAVAASVAMGHGLTFLTADENRRPKELYARLGFDAVTRVWDFWKGGDLG